MRCWHYVLHNYVMMPLLTIYDVREAILNCGNWQRLFFPSLLGQNSETDSLPESAERALFVLSVNIYEILFYHRFSTTEVKGEMLKVLSGTVNEVVARAGWTPASRTVVSVMLMAFLRKVEGGSKLFATSSMLESCWQNLLETLAVVEDYLLYRPCVAGIERVTSDKERRRTFPGLHVDMSGCMDTPIVEQVVKLLTQLLKGEKMSFAEDRSSKRAEQQVAEHYQGELEFYTKLLMHFKMFDSGAKSPQQFEAKGTIDLSRAQDKLHATVKAIVHLIEKRPLVAGCFNKARTKKELDQVMMTILRLQRNSKSSDIERIAARVMERAGPRRTHISVSGGGGHKQLNTLHRNWKSFGSLRGDAAKLTMATSTHSRRLDKKAEKKKQQAPYIFVDMFYRDDGTFVCQFFVPHLDEESKVKLKIDKKKRVLFLQFFGIGSRTRGTNASRYFRRETKTGTLQKYIYVPKDVDLDSRPSLRLQANSALLVFGSAASDGQAAPPAKPGMPGAK